MIKHYANLSHAFGEYCSQQMTCPYHAACDGQLVGQIQYDIIFERDNMKILHRVEPFDWIF